MLRTTPSHFVKTLDTRLSKIEDANQALELPGRELGFGFCHLALNYNCSKGREIYRRFLWRKVLKF